MYLASLDKVPIIYPSVSSEFNTWIIFYHNLHYQPKNILELKTFSQTQNNLSLIVGL